MVLPQNRPFSNLKRSADNTEPRNTQSIHIVSKKKMLVTTHSEATIVFQELPVDHPSILGTVFAGEVYSVPLLKSTNFFPSSASFFNKGAGSHHAPCCA